LPSTGQVWDPLYSITGEAVLTLKRPIRGNKSHTESEIDQSIMMDTWYIRGMMDDEDETRIIS
jgi:hypothetical protein